MPECDIQGYYKPVQCHNAIGMCWCVDKHGVEFANTRTHSKPTCGKLDCYFLIFLTFVLETFQI